MSLLSLSLVKNQVTSTLLLGGSIKAGLSRTKNLSVPASLKDVVVLCGTNNLFTDSSLDLADCIVHIGSCGLILRDESWSVNRVLIKDVNKIPLFKA